jgi:hypothetical protein
MDDQREAGLIWILFLPTRMVLLASRGQVAAKGTMRWHTDQTYYRTIPATVAWLSCSNQNPR